MSCTAYSVCRSRRKNRLRRIQHFLGRFCSISNRTMPNWLLCYSTSEKMHWLCYKSAVFHSPVLFCSVVDASSKLWNADDTEKYELKTHTPIHWCFTSVGRFNEHTNVFWVLEAGIGLCLNETQQRWLDGQSVELSCDSFILLLHVWYVFKQKPANIK